ncbi:hypothetical protein ONE63_000224 [Megalurothrips usitatus]|uniref:Uncharacterized protein n=1 Tax=Megalurothrips usitatus TaxID=439358 RepID=A0AAV7XXT5_9NEOP|nr:hypothetical protein ONE63_000224 [Megalurothrips usitatus]
MSPKAGVGLLKELRESLKIGRQENEFCDTLSTEELSALLPGSRKPLTSSSSNFERSLSSGSISNGSTENNYFLNYNSLVHDLSEEEENNGSIKVVHFGVV